MGYHEMYPAVSDKISFVVPSTVKRTRLKIVLLLFVVQFIFVTKRRIETYVLLSIATHYVIYIIDNNANDQRVHEAYIIR